MVQKIVIQNFKSIKDLTLELGRVNIFIGENGAGKSNILEAIALAGAAVSNKLDNEFLASRGIRTSEPRHMRNALAGGNSDSPIYIGALGDSSSAIGLTLSHDGKPYSNWTVDGWTKDELFERAILIRQLEELLQRVKDGRYAEDPADENQLTPERGVAMLREMEQRRFADDAGTSDIKDFLIYSPENSSLRVFEKEGQIEPLGIRGEGLLKYLQVLNSEPSYAGTLTAIQQALGVLDWFGGMDIPSPEINKGSRIQITDRYLAADAGCLDQTSANEGFLFLLFYFCLFSSDLTPRFFAIDNVDASLNPKLCARLIVELNRLAVEHKKQAILTTHNPATLDGLDLTDDQQRLFVISRGPEGDTRVRRIQYKEGAMSGIKLSAAFVDGYLGGLPQNF